VLYGVSVEMPRGKGFITVGVFENFGVAKFEAKRLIDSFQTTSILAEINY
jgi:hypothetical protein